MGKVILVIENDTAIRENTVEILELSGYEVVSAENGKTGFEIAKRLRPDAIICDILMPITDGRAFFKLVKEEASTVAIPLIFFSADSGPDSVKKGIMKGANEYLKKPFTRNDLLDAVARCLDGNHGK